MDSLSTQSPSRVSNGFSLVEALLAISLFSLILMLFAGSFYYGQEATALTGDRQQAILYAHEGLEAVRNIRDDDFADLEAGSYGVEIDNNRWELTENTEVTSKYERQILVTNVDEVRRDVESIVTWQQRPGRDGQITLATRLTNWREQVSASPLVVQGKTTSEWGSGYCYVFTITNTGDQPAPTWELTFDVTQFSIYSNWNGDYDLQGGTYTVTPENYNRNIPPGGSVNDIGYCANKTGTPFLPENLQATIPQQSTENLVYSIELTSDWSSGYCAELQITNQGQDTVSTWETYIDTNDSSINDTWNANYTSVGGGIYRVTPLSWNSEVEPGETISSPGFCADKTGANYTPTITDGPPGNSGGNQGGGNQGNGGGNQGGGNQGGNSGNGNGGGPPGQGGGGPGNGGGPPN